MGMRPSSNPDGFNGSSHGGHGGRSKVEVFVRWGELTGPMSGQADLQAALDSKAALGHTHSWGAITNRATSLQGYGITDAVHLPDYVDDQAALAVQFTAVNDSLATKATIASLTAGLATKADLAHAHPVSDITGLQGTLDTLASDIAGKASIIHTHVISDVTGLQAALDAKMPLTGGTFTGDISVPGEAYGIGWDGSFEAPTKNDVYDKIEAMTLGVVSDWGDLGGTLADQTDLQTALDAKANLSGCTFTGDIIVPDEAYSPTWDANYEAPTKNAVYDKIQALIVAAGTISDGDYGDVLVGGTGSTMTVQTVGGVVPSLVGHTHIIGDVTGLQAALDGKATLAHTHIIGDVTGLQAALDGKQAAGSYQPAGSYADAVHSHIIADVTGLQAALDGKQPAGSYALASHTHSGDFAAAVHTHTIANITGLQTELNTKLEAADIANKANLYMAIVSSSANTTLANATHNNGVLTMTGSTTRTITANSTPAVGFSCVIHNTASVNMTLSAAGGVYKNGATGTTTSGTIPAGGLVTVIHKGSGVWIARGDIT